MKKLIPILFSTMMVQAILRLISPKLVTRRTIGLNAVNKRPDEWVTAGQLAVNEKGKLVQTFTNKDDNFNQVSCVCPYGKPGDILWVRETFFKNGDEYIYLADGTCCEQFEQCECYDIGKPKWKPSIHMPYAACRIWLKIKSIRLERLHDITEEQAIAEGVELHHEGKYWLDYEKQAGKVTQAIYCLYSAKESIASLWRLINGRDAWRKNPWVWVVEFERTEKPEVV